MVYQDPRYRYAPPPGNYPAYPPPYAYPYPYPVAPRPPSPNLPTAGGVLVLIAGALSLLWTVMMWSGFAILGIGSWTCFVLELVFAIIAIIGGLFAMARRMFGLAVLGAIFSMLTFGFFFISPVLGLIGLILILIGKEAFIPSGRSRGPSW
jgi:amino acid transporter